MAPTAHSPSLSDRADWRALIEKELPGAPFASAADAQRAFEKALVYRTAEGLSVQPLYTEASSTVAARASGSFGICMRHERLDPTLLADDLASGADALWLAGEVGPAELDAVCRSEAGPEAGPEAGRIRWLLDGGPSVLNNLDGLRASGARVCLGLDPLTLRDLVIEPLMHAESPALLVSTLPYHAAGADAADELACALSMGVAYLRRLDNIGVERATALAQIAVRVAVGRDTFAELCKLRALRVCWAKLCAAVDAPPVLPLLHAVSSSRTLTARDPWVNLLRVSTQLFAAILGGADLVTPAPFDAALGDTDARRQAHRIARNTGLVLREESDLGRVADAAGGAYYFESFTDALAREAWTRFTAMERDGGIVAVEANGTLRARLAAAWSLRAGAIAKRKEPITGVSEFANLDELRPRVSSPPLPSTGLPAHRDAEAFEALRDRAETLRDAGVHLVTLGPPAEHRARLAFASALLATGGLRAQLDSAVVCLCGSDERYAVEAGSAAHAAKAQGATRVLLAGRPGALEAELRSAGVDDFIYVGCDAVAVLSAVQRALS